MPQTDQTEDLSAEAIAETNAEAGAFPWGDTIAGICGGLTKRELFAAMALQGLLANLAAVRNLGFKDEELERFARLRADRLLVELAK